MDTNNNIPQEFSRVLADLVVYYITAANLKDAAVRQRHGVVRWSDLKDEILLSIVGSVSRNAQMPTPDRNRIVRMARIRCLAGREAANYGDNLFALSDERLKGIENDLLLNTPKAAIVPAPVRETRDSQAKPASANKTSPFQKHSYTLEGYTTWRSTSEGRARYKEAEQSSIAALESRAKSWGMKRIFEDKRWHGEAGWNNNWTAPMGRELCQNHPEWPRDFFETRSSKADNWTFDSPE